MDLMSIRRGLMSQMASGAKIYSGTYIPESDSPYATIDTGVTGWTHFLIVPHELPYVVAHARCMGAKYVDLVAQYYLAVYGPSSSDFNVPSTCKALTVGSSPTYSDSVDISNSTIEFKRLAASQGGTFQAGTQYDWYAW